MTNPAATPYNALTVSAREWGRRAAEDGLDRVPPYKQLPECNVAWLEGYDAVLRDQKRYREVGLDSD